MSILSSIASAQRQTKVKASVLPPGVLVDDFYNVSHGADDAISIRLAIAHAIANNISKVSFSNKTYNLGTSIADPNNPYNYHVFIYVQCTSWMQVLELEGNGAVLFRSGSTTLTDFATIMVVEAAIKNVRIKGIHFKRELELYDADAVRSCAGLIYRSLVNREDIDSVILEDCIFTDCHRSFEFGAGFWPAEPFIAATKLKSLIIRNCQLIYPRGSNELLPTSGYYYGGSQGAWIDAWVNDVWIDACYFDGAESGTWAGNGGSPPVDGMFISQAVTTRVTNCVCKHYDYEGMYFQKAQWHMGDVGIPVVIPAVDLTFILHMYRWTKYAGVLVGDRLLFRANRDPHDYSMSHEVEVVAITTTQPAEDPDPTFTLRVISGSPETRTGGIFIVHKKSQDRPTYGYSLDNRFVDIAVTRDGIQHKLPYNIIEFYGVDHCFAIGNYGEETQWSINTRVMKNAVICNNTIHAARIGYHHMSPQDAGSSHTVFGNTITLTDLIRFEDGGDPRQFGIQIHGGFADIYENEISHDSSEFTEATGIRMYFEVPSSKIHNNRFFNLYRDVENENFPNLHYAYFDNTFVAVESLQARYPEIYENDTQAAIGTLPQGAVPVGGIYTLPSGEYTYRQT